MDRNFPKSMYAADIPLFKIIEMSYDRNGEQVITCPGLRLGACRRKGATARTKPYIS